MAKFLSLLDGIRVAYLEWGHASASLGKVIALHGWLDNANSFAYLGPHLAAKGYHVIAYDNIGHGYSDHFGSGGLHSLHRAVGVVNEVVSSLNVNKQPVHIVGHSMGASISLMYAATYPEKVDKLVMIDGLGPIVEPADHAARHLRRALDAETDFKKRLINKREKKRYKTVQDAIEARLMSVKVYPGKQYLSREAAQALVARGLEMVDKSTLEIEKFAIKDESKGPVSFRYDPRLLLPSYSYYTPEQAWSFYKEINSKTLILTAQDGWPWKEGGHEKDVAARLKILSEKGLLQHVELPGSHHFHLDPDHAPKVAQTIDQFLLIK